MRAAPDELRRHAAHLDTVTDELEHARSAGDGAGITPDAYGHLCAVVPVLLEQVRSPLAAAIGAAARATGDSAEAVRRAADEYQRADEAAAESLLTGGPRQVAPARDPGGPR